MSTLRLKSALNDLMARDYLRRDLQPRADLRPDLIGRRVLDPEQVEAEHDCGAGWRAVRDAGSNRHDV